MNTKTLRITVLVNPLTLIINQMLKTEIFPDKLKIAKVIRIYKKDDETPFSNYHPILLLPAISKIVFMQLYTYFKDNKFFFNYQYGFREGHSTEWAVLELINRVIKEMNNGETPFNNYLALSKVVDTLDYSIFTEKLKYYSIKHTEIRLFVNYLSNKNSLLTLKAHHHKY